MLQVSWKKVIMSQYHVKKSLLMVEPTLSYMNVVGKNRQIWQKLHILRYLKNEFSMIVELFSDRPFIEKLFCRFKILISHFLITLPFPENLTEIYRKFLRNFSENSYIHHLPTLPTHHPIHTHQSPAYPNPPRTLNSIFFTMRFFFQIYRLFPTPFIWYVND